MKFRRALILRRMAWLVFPLLALSLLRLDGESSLAEKTLWMLHDKWSSSPTTVDQAPKRFLSKHRTGNKNHRDVDGRMRDFFRRHPSLEPEWRDVPYHENGYLLLRDFVEGNPPPDFSMDESIKKMMAGDLEWDHESVSRCLRERENLLAKLRHIGSLTDRSSKGVPWRRLEFIGVRPYVQATEWMALSMQHHLRNSNFEAALLDFAVVRGIASHLDGHEVPTLLSKTAGIFVRMQMNENLVHAWQYLPADMDFTPWIKLLAIEEPFGLEMARVYAGECLATTSLIIRSGEIEMDKLNIFEDAMADETMLIVDSLQRDGTLPDLGKTAERLAKWKAIDSNAYEFLVHSGYHQWHKGAVSGYVRTAITLAGLEIHQAENTGGPITDVDDPRLDEVTLDPSNGRPFVFDPTKRELSPDADSSLTRKDDKHVIRLPRR